MSLATQGDFVGCDWPCLENAEVAHTIGSAHHSTSRYTQAFNITFVLNAGCNINGNEEEGLQGESRRAKAS